MLDVLETHPELSAALIAFFTVVIGVVIAVLLLQRSFTEDDKLDRKDGTPREVAGAKQQILQEASPHFPKTACTVEEKVKKVVKEPVAKLAASRNASSIARATPTSAVSASASSSSSGKVPEPVAEVVRIDRIGGSNLWLWRSKAVRKLVRENCDGEAFELIRRRIWECLDDRPRYVASGCGDGQGRVFDIRSNLPALVSVRHDPGAREPLTSILFAPGPNLHTASWDGKLHGWEAFPQKPLRGTEFARGEQGVGHENLVTGLAISRDGNKLAVACTVGRVLVFQGNCPVKEYVVTEQEELVNLKESLKLGDYGELYVKELGVSLAGIPVDQFDELLPEAAFEGKNSRRDVDKLELPAILRFRFTGCLTKGHKKAWRRLPHDGAVKCLEISAEGTEEFLYSGGRDRKVTKWSLSDGEPVHILEGHTSMVRCLAVNSEYIASGSDDRTVRLWKRETPTLIRSLVGHTDFVRAVALCPNLTNRCVSAGDDHRVILWDAGIGARLFEFPHVGKGDILVNGLLLNASLLVTAGEDKQLRVWHVESATLDRQMRHPLPVTCVSWLSSLR